MNKLVALGFSHSVVGDVEEVTPEVSNFISILLQDVILSTTSCLILTDLVNIEELQVYQKLLILSLRGYETCWNLVDMSSSQNSSYEWLGHFF